MVAQYRALYDDAPAFAGASSYFLIDKTNSILSAMISVYSSV